MPKIKVIKPFKFAHGGHTVQEFEPSDEPIDTSDECAELAVKQGWAKNVKARAAAPAAADALRARITELEQQLASATDESSKSALAAELQAKQAELAELG
jgi:hypothetical protein